MFFKYQPGKDPSVALKTNPMILLNKQLALELRDLPARCVLTRTRRNAWTIQLAPDGTTGDQSANRPE